MHIILTHEQADFDALGALFGAALVNEDSVAVLPRKQNRNVRAFLNLYGQEFPFVDPRDLPSRSVQSVTLVDTQSLVTVKGMGGQTRIRSIDHHARRDSTPPDWELIALKTGATTTYFVELLEERDEALSSMQSTLLLLGIYEDTGSLSYPDTTARDVRATAWLLEQGASLQIAAGYLNPPLSEEQRGAYDTLVRSAQTHPIDGLRVVIAQADLPGLTDEISALAHKLRDVLDPDALFVLVHTGEGLRLVARSTTDRLDVATVTAAFGGGGHERAASALVRNSEEGDGSLLESTSRRLLELLPKHIRPAITVAHLMSRMPRTLAPDTPAPEAARLMQKYGYEGFPVVDDGHVVGLLTRRAVDGAVGHGLNLTAASLMETGNVSVHTSDSVQRLQALMGESGWGQIPVTDETGKLIGIVTRTDLLKTLAPTAAGPGRKNLAEKLERELPASQRELLHTVATQAATMHLPVYIVGGFVRDILLGRPTLDFDVVVEGDAISLARALAKMGGGKVTAHDRFGTAKWFLPKSEPALPAFLDLITARLEFYEHPAALPGVEHGSIRHDLHRRDFTINTLALRLDGHHFGELHDYYGGVADLDHGLVRVLHSLSFIDDPTRLLRAGRYEQRYGFTIESRTRQLLDEARPLISRLSPERVRHELDLIFDEPLAAGMLARLDELGLLEAISAELPWSEDMRGRLRSGLAEPLPPAWDLVPPSSIVLQHALGYALWLQDLSPAQVDRIHARLEFSGALLKIIRGAAGLKADLPSLAGKKPSAQTFHLGDLPLLSIYAVFLAELNPARRQLLEAYALKRRKVQATVGGSDLIALGLPRGPRYQTMLNRLRAAWLDGEVSSPEEEQQLLQRLIASGYGSNPERQ
jgi:tRNA nucleotidyltransferase (CCA-adding enzyme)